jgi:hypothetical protein
MESVKIFISTILLSTAAKATAQPSQFAFESGDHSHANRNFKAGVKKEE